MLASSLQTSRDAFLILSITSTNIQKIIFEQWPLSPRRRSSLDIALSDLVDRLNASGYNRTLGLELRPGLGSVEVDSDINLNDLFPRFTEKGRVIIREGTDGKILCRSGR